MKQQHLLQLLLAQPTAHRSPLSGPQTQRPPTSTQRVQTGPESTLLDSGAEPLSRPFRQVCCRLPVAQQEANRVKEKESSAHMRRTATRLSTSTVLLLQCARPLSGQSTPDPGLADCPPNTVSTGLGAGGGGCVCAPGYTGSVQWSTLTSQYIADCIAAEFPILGCEYLYVDCTTEVAFPGGWADKDSLRKNDEGNKLTCGCSLAKSKHQCISAADEHGNCCKWVESYEGPGPRPNNCWPPNEGNWLTCGDMTKCSHEIDGWDCCVGRGDRVACPASHPVMCDRANACGNGRTHCCAETAFQCYLENAGSGARPCSSGYCTMDVATAKAAGGSNLDESVGIHFVPRLAMLAAVAGVLVLGIL
eukprot:SAG31_NODE_50_length_30520_cov_89.906712_31_plen_362_part_00